MINRLMALLIVGLFVVPLDADARGWSWKKLGTASTKDECNARAERLLKSYPTLKIAKQPDGVISYGVNKIDIDAVITCASGADGRAVAVLVLHSWDDGTLNERRFELMKEIADRW